MSCSSETKKVNTSEINSINSNKISKPHTESKKQEERYDTAEYAQKYAALANGDSSGKWGPASHHSST